jgi:hypothetical protein
MVETDIWFTRWTGLSEKIVDIKQIPRTRIVQLASGESSIWILGSFRTYSQRLDGGIDIVYCGPHSYKL